MILGLAHNNNKDSVVLSSLIFYRKFHYQIDDT